MVKHKGVDGILPLKNKLLEQLKEDFFKEFSMSKNLIKISCYPYKFKSMLETITTVIDITKGK